MRLNPDRLLESIISTLKKCYCEPDTEPPINPNSIKTGKPSDHLVVVMEPITATLLIQSRQYRPVEIRPINFAGLEKCSRWVENYNWMDVYRCEGSNAKAEMIQNILAKQYYECFPIKVIKVSCDDRAWFSPELKELDRKRKREFSKNHQSDLWNWLSDDFEVNLCRS